MTTWYAFLNRIRFPTHTKAIIYRVWLDQALLTPGKSFVLVVISQELGLAHDVADVSVGVELCAFERRRYKRRELELDID